jgi:uncharacterized metal-binding protein YceD (DUF177 family)
MKTKTTALAGSLIISIKGLQDGKYTVSASAECEYVEGMFPEFFGTIRVSGNIQKLAKRYILMLRAECQARMLCDVSGEEFTEPISTELTLNYIANTHLFLEQMDDPDPEPPLYIREDDTVIDITEEVRQELAVHLPVKRIAPQYRETSFGEIYPDYDADASASGSQDIDPRWAALKGISFQ